MEALVNFHDDKLTEVFKRRVTHLNITHNGLSDLIKDKAEKTLQSTFKNRSRLINR